MDDKLEQAPLETPTPEIPEVHEIIPEVREGSVRSEHIRVSDTCRHRRHWSRKMNQTAKGDEQERFHEQLWGVRRSARYHVKCQQVFDRRKKALDLVTLTAGGTTAIISVGTPTFWVRLAHIGGGGDIGA